MQFTKQTIFIRIWLGKNHNYFPTKLIYTLERNSGKYEANDFFIESHDVTRYEFI